MKYDQVKVDDGVVLYRAVVPSYICAPMIASAMNEDAIYHTPLGSKFETYPYPPTYRPVLASYAKEVLAEHADPSKPILFDAIELANVKRYPSSGSMDWHTDNATLDTQGRILGFLFYLNDDYSGGETVYATELGGKSIRGRTGDVLVFDPSKPHRGSIVLDGDKWIATAYLRKF